MPKRAWKVCGHRGCPKRTRARYCEQHRNDNWQGWQERRGTSTQRGYGAEWRRIRKRILARDDYLCQPCLRKRRTTAATEVDHIVPLEHGGGEGDDNLQAICTRHHREKTAREGRAGRGGKK